MSDRHGDGPAGGDEFSGFLAEVEQSISEVFAPEPPPPAPPAPDAHIAAAETWLDPERFVIDFVDLAARLVEEPDR